MNDTTLKAIRMVRQGKISLLPISSDSMGVRSFSVFIKTPDTKILIDPGIAFAPRRYGLPPHPIELKTLNHLAKKIETYGNMADVIIVTHYHRDHFDYGSRVSPQIYENKIVLLKDPKKNINPNQKYRRAPAFLRLLEKYSPKQILFADGETISIENTEITFSHPVYHGADSKLGYVIEVCVKYKDRKVLFSSDIGGGVLEDQINFILENKPDIVILDGPVTYLRRRKDDTLEVILEKVIENIALIVNDVKPRYLIIDHHVLRDKDYKAFFAALSENTKHKHTKIMSLASFLGLEDKPLESLRDELYKRFLVD